MATTTCGFGAGADRRCLTPRGVGVAVGVGATAAVRCSLRGRGVAATVGRGVGVRVGVTWVLFNAIASFSRSSLGGVAAASGAAVSC
ncbi:MAG: hypothetical protein ACREDI_06895, partial [Roseiarcus sp.]